MGEKRESEEYMNLFVLLTIAAPVCEAEGGVLDPGAASLLFSCKNTLKLIPFQTVFILRWSSSLVMTLHFKHGQRLSEYIFRPS